MTSFKKSVFLARLLFLFIVSFCLRDALASNEGFSIGGFHQSFPGPYLFSPVTENIDLSKKDCLEFKWRRSDFVYTFRYEFRLYKGYQQGAATLVLKRVVLPDEYPLSISSSNFEEGQVYTWALVQVLNDGRKSDKSFSSFKIKKK